MDFKLENENLGMIEKNKKLFSDLSREKVDISEMDEFKENQDTFKTFKDFLTEKEGLLEITDEIVKYSLAHINRGMEGVDSTKFKNIKKLLDLINFKNRVIMCLENYQELPGLLDPILGLVVPNIMNNSLFVIKNLLIKPDQENLIVLQCLYQIIYILCKIRGFSTITKFFSSEVHVFEPVISFLLTLNPREQDNWFLLYVLLLWTSILGLIPFDIETIDSNNIITASLYEYYKQTLNLSGNLRDIASYSLSKFLTRPDVIKKGLLKNFYDYSISCLHNADLQFNIFLILGLMSALCEIFKYGLPKDLISFVPLCVNYILKHNFSSSVKSSGVFNKMLIQLTQRLGLVLLKPKFQQWRYQMKYNYLMSSKKSESEKNDSQNFESSKDELDYDIDFEILETLIDYLLTGLSHKEYIVRWSSAKGLGRLCERLTKQMVDDILQSILSLFQNEENEYSWQGACLSIAELCKRGMILPESLHLVMKYLEKSLIFEVNKGTFCSGSNVRDSACYVVWALARAYSREVMKPFVFQIVKNLILCILFDKEVNCRRAASAAFQEHVGRQGYFPHGIEILAEADYFTLGNRANCFLNISTFIAQYPEYFQTIVDYLSFNRLLHVDLALRELTAETLSLLVSFKPQYFTEDILPKLIPLCYSKALHVRHGAITGIGYILVGLSGKWDIENKAKRIRKKMLDGMNTNEKQVLEDSDYRKQFEFDYNKIKFINNLNILREEIKNEILQIPLNLEEKNLYRGKGSEVMRTAVNNLIRLISESKIVICENTLLFYFEVLIDNLKHPNLDIQKESCHALKLLNETYSELLNIEKVFNELEKKLLWILKLAVSDESIYITRGFTMCIPYFEKNLITKYYNAVLETLYTNAKMKQSNNNDADTRKYALESLTWLAIKFLNSSDKSPISQDLQKILSFILEGLEDYEIDKKIGDVGSKVREAAIISLTSLMLSIYKTQEYVKLFHDNVVIYLKGLVKQLGEKMAKMRLAAGDCLQRFFFELKDEKNTNIESIPNWEELKLTFLDDIVLNENDEINNLKWLEPSYSYKRISNILSYDSYSYSLFEGLIISIGGITEDTQRFSLEVIDQVLKDETQRKLLVNNLYSHILQIFEKYPKEDRVIEPLFNTLCHFLTKLPFVDAIYLEKVDLIHRNITRENFDSNNIHKVLASVDIFYNLLFFPKEEKFNLFNRCLKSLIVLMTHKYPVVRKKAAEKIYLFLLSLEDFSVLGIDSDAFDNVSIILTETNWADSITTIREQRNLIANILGIPLDNLVKTKMRNQNEFSSLEFDETLDTSKHDTEDHYDKIINEYGYGWQVWKLFIIVVLIFISNDFFPAALPMMVQAFQKKYNISEEQISIISVIFSLSKMMGCLLAGFASTYLSRLLLTRIICGILFIFNLTMAIFENYSLFLIVRNAGGFCTGILEVIVINSLCEFLPTRWRSFFLNSSYVGYNLGQLLISLTMMLMMPNMEFSGITHCYYVFASVSFLVFVLCFILYHDSPRNLIVCGEDEKAFEILYTIKERSYFTQEIQEKIKHNILRNVYKEKSGIFEFLKIFKNEYLFTTLIITGCMVAGNWVTDGSRLITNFLLEKSDLNISKSSIVTSNLILNIVTPFSCILFGYISELKYLGRKLSIFLGFLFMSLSLIPALIWPSGMLWYLTILSFLTNVSNLVTTYSSEVYPTEMRDLAFGWFNFSSYLSSALSQYFVMLPLKNNWKISVILLISSCVLADILICFSPLEPLDKPIDSDFRQCQPKETNKYEEDKQKLI